MKDNWLNRVFTKKEHIDTTNSQLSDCVKYINEIRELVNKYTNMPSACWDMYEIRKELNKYVLLTSDYIESNYQFINKSILVLIRESLYDLNYFIITESYGEKTNNYLSTCYNTSLYYLKGENSKDIEKEYYKRKTSDLINKVANKYDFNVNIPLKDLKHYKLITDGFGGVCLTYLYDILRGDFSSLSFKTKKDEKNEIDCEIKYSSNDRLRLSYIYQEFMKIIILKSYFTMLKNDEINKSLEENKKTR